MFSFDLLAFLVASISTLALIYYKAPTTISQQGIAFLLVTLIILSKKFVSSPSQLSSKLFRFILLLLSSLFVQLLVISSGGFYSPFLILLHFYTLGASFLLKIGSAISFLVLSLIVLIISTLLNQTLLSIFHQDPGSAVLYLVSFLVIVPLAQYLMSTYNLKDTISKVLTETLLVGEKREQSILQGLNELVLVTDINLKILSYNSAVEKSLLMHGLITGNNLLGVLRLTDKNGNEATAESLSIDKVMENRAAHLVEGFYLEIKEAKRLKVIIQIRPVVNPTGLVNQIVFVIKDSEGNLEEHSDLERAKVKQKQLIDNLKRSIEDLDLPAAEAEAILVAKAEEDLLIAQDLEDHPFKVNIGYLDIVELCQQVSIRKSDLARSLNIKLQFVFPSEEIGEAARLELKSSVSESSLPPSELAVPTDSRWLSLILEKLIDLAILINSGGSEPNVSLTLKRHEAVIEIFITSSPAQLLEEEKVQLLSRYYGNLGYRANLKLGSGLEGFIVKTVATELKVPIFIQIGENLVVFNVQLSKQPNTQV